MKSILFTLVAVALLGLLAYTNPTLDSYQEYVHQSILRETNHQENPLEQVLGSLLGGVASGMIAKQTLRTDYVSSTYDTQFNQEHLRAIGVLKNFYILETPTALSKKMTNHAHAPITPAKASSSSLLMQPWGSATFSAASGCVLQ